MAIKYFILFFKRRFFPKIGWHTLQNFPYIWHTWVFLHQCARWVRVSICKQKNGTKITVEFVKKIKNRHFRPKMAYFAFRSLPYIGHTWVYLHQCARWVRVSICKQKNGTKITVEFVKKIKNRHFRPKMAYFSFRSLPYIWHTWVFCINVPVGIV